MSDESAEEIHYQLGSSNLKTKDKDLAERWAMPELGYNSEIEKALSLNYVFDFLVCKKRHSRKIRYLIYKSNISQIEKWWYFEHKEENRERDIECLFINKDGLVESQFFWSDYPPSNEDMIEAGKKGHLGSIFVQASDMRGHSEYLDEVFFDKKELVYAIQHDRNNEKTPKLTRDKRLLKRSLSRGKRFIFINNAAANVSCCILKDKKKRKMAGYSKAMKIATRHHIKFQKHKENCAEIFANNEVA